MCCEAGGGGTLSISFFEAAFFVAFIWTDGVFLLAFARGPGCVVNKGVALLCGLFNVEGDLGCPTGEREEGTKTVPAPAKVRPFWPRLNHSCSCL